MKTKSQVKNNLKNLEQEILKAGDKKKAVLLGRYFKTGKGEYGEGDIFIGITVPAMREIALKYKTLALPDIQKLLKSSFHEYRSAALEILDAQYQAAVKAGDKKTQKSMYDFYLKNTKYINNWDLVDMSARDIVGHYCFTHGSEVLYKLAVSKNIWERRIAIIATAYFIKEKQFTETFKISELLLQDTHDLIHKAVGWMLREVGNKSQEAEEKFLEKHYKTMPRTMLRYAIEKFSPAKRAYYMKK